MKKPQVAGKNAHKLALSGPSARIHKWVKSSTSSTGSGSGGPKKVVFKAAPGAGRPTVVVTTIRSKKTAVAPVTSFKLVQASSKRLKAATFEALVGTLLEAMGYRTVSLPMQTNDSGVDFIAEKQGVQMMVQCKHQLRPVATNTIREVVNSLITERYPKALVVTASTVTSEARQAANRLGVQIWDRDQLKEMLSTYGLQAPSDLLQGSDSRVRLEN